MKILISPAKSLDFKSEIGSFKCTQPKFLDKTLLINSSLKEKTPNDLKKIQNISEKLADLNWTRNNDFNLSHNYKNSRPALFAFNGDVYDGIDAKSLSSDNVNNLQNQLRILSGLYGILKPLDLIQPYRLEMGTKLSLNGSKNLYEFWRDIITKELLNETKNDSLIINLASNEYFNVLNKNAIESRIITPVFKDFKNGNYKIISFYAKKARGMMARWVVKKGITSKSKLKNFNLGGYVYNPEYSSSQKPVFLRG